MKIKLVLLCSFMLLIITVSSNINAENLNTLFKNNIGFDDPLHGVSFYQVDFKWNKSTFYNSAVGEIVVDIDTLIAGSGLTSGFVNGYSSEGWVIMNIYISEDNDANEISTFFDLGTEGQVRSINIYMDYSKDPTYRFSAGTMTTYTVDDTIYNAEGDTEEIILQSITPPIAGKAADYYEITGATYDYYQSGHPNVQTCSMQCVPSAYANNIQYIENIFGVPEIDDEHIPGVGGIPTDSLVGQFDIVIGRFSLGPYYGLGTPYDDAIYGFLEYIVAHAIADELKVRHQGLSGNNDFHWPNPVVPLASSYGQGDEVEFNYILGQIKEGYAVGLLYWRYNALNEKVGGHMVQLVRAGYILGVPFIELKDDGIQADPVDDPDFTEGLRVRQRYLVDTDDDGKYNVIGASMEPEVELIVIMESENQPPDKPVISGPTPIKKGIEYDFTFKATDPDNDDVEFKIFWGDYTHDYWIGPYNSGEEAVVSHTYEDNGLYTIRAQARDEHGCEGEYGEKQILVSRQKSTNICQRFPILFNILKLGRLLSR